MGDADLQFLVTPLIVPCVLFCKICHLVGKPTRLGLDACVEGRITWCERLRPIVVEQVVDAAEVGNVRVRLVHVARLNKGNIVGGLEAVVRDTAEGVRVATVGGLDIVLLFLIVHGPATV